MKSGPMFEMTRARLMMVGSLLMILGLFGLDLRDLYYKLHMLGPYDSYSFRTVGYDTIQSKPIPKPVDTIAKLMNGSSTAASGWPSFYSRCKTLYASGTETSRFFLTTLAHNCSIDLSANETRVVPQILVTASMRVDAMVAVSCQLLFTARRPPICQDAMAIGFNDRYQIEEEAPTFAEMAQPDSNEELELLRFLEMVSFSYPMTHMTCGEAFELEPGAKGVFRSSVFVCSSPNMFRSEWIGFVNKAVSRFLVTKGWLTADVIAFMGVRYGIRQNSIDIYDVSYSSSGTMQLASSSLVNFCSYGHLYALSVLIDILLLVAHCLSTFEVLKWILVPQYLELQAWIHDFEDESPQLAVPQSMQRKGLFSKLQTRLSQALGIGVEHKYTSGGSSSNLKAKPLVHAATDGGAVVFEEVQFYSFFSRSFYRNEHYVLLTTITQVLSWVIILPNSVIWTWSDSLTQQIQGYLSSIKCWVLIASSANFLWSVIVKIDERRAYWFVRGTYLTNPEIIAIGAFVAFADSKSIFSISGAKYTLEQQRHYDFSSFTDGYLGYSNAYDKSQDYVTTTPLKVAWLVYKPLVSILLYSLLVCAIYLTLKYAFFYYYIDRDGRDKLLRLLGRPTRPKGTTVHIADGDSSAATASPDASTRSSAPTEYQRLPLEEALGCPIRAISLVRNTLSMEIVKDGKTYIRPSCYLDFGVMLKNGHVETRIGFNDIFKAHMPIPEPQGPVEGARDATARALAATPATTGLPLSTGTTKSLLLASPATSTKDDGANTLATDTTLRATPPSSPTRKSPRGMTATTANASMSGRTTMAEHFTNDHDHDPATDAHISRSKLPPLDKPPRVPPDEGTGAN